MKGWLDKYQVGGNLLNSQTVTMVNNIPQDIINESNSPFRFNILKNAVRNSSFKSDQPLTDLEEKELDKSTRDLLAEKQAKLSNVKINYNTKQEKNEAASYDSNNRVISFTDKLNAESPDLFKEVARHEWNHVFDDSGSLLTDYEKDAIQKSTAEARRSMLSPFNKIGADMVLYLTRPTEVNARLRAIREGLKDQGVYDGSKENATLDHLKHASKIRGYTDLQEVMSDDDIVNLLNTIAANKAQQGVPMAKYGGWLEKYNDGGPVQENYNDYSVSAPEGYVGDGTFNEGRDYSPAWGGQFQNGGELANVTVKGKRQPIIVTNPNDSRLKAYKDSLALYNEGEKNYKKRLEFNKKNNIPKSSTRKWNDPVEYHIVNKTGDIQPNKIQPIEGNGYWYNFDPDNVTGTNVPSSLTDNYGFRYKKPTQPVEYINRIRQTETPELQDLAMELPVSMSLPELQRQAGPNRITMGRPLFKGGPQTDYYTPIDEAGNVAQSNDFRTSQYAMGGSIPGAVGFTYARTQSPAPSNGKYAKKTMASAQNGKQIGPDGIPITAVTDQKEIDARLKKHNNSKEGKRQADQLDKINEVGPRAKDALINFSLKSMDNIATTALNTVFPPYFMDKPQWLREETFKAYRPTSYPDATTAIRDAYHNVNPERDDQGMLDIGEEAWSKALGLGEKSNYIIPSTQKPANAKDPNAKYYTLRPGIIDQQKLIDFVRSPEYAKYKHKSKDNKTYVMEHPAMNNFINEDYLKYRKQNKLTDYDQIDPIQGFQIYNGWDAEKKKNFAAIYDKYDFDAKAANSMIKPYEFYDKFYYQNGGKMSYYQNGLDFEPKSIGKNGSVIKDDMGQWAHPGEITEIGSNQITMQGVPYPVLGISDTGDIQMMYPNQDYTYEGSSVTEYPMAQEGMTVSSALDMLDYPQKKMMQGLTGKEQKPSDWIKGKGYFNQGTYRDKGMLLAADVIADPLNFIPVSKLKYLRGLKGEFIPDALNTLRKIYNTTRTGTQYSDNASDVFGAFKQGGQLTKLDQLTNFTNYNTKQPGGWLDKYQ